MDKQPPRFETITSAEVWDWPEYKALAKRLGIDMSLPTTKIEIMLEHESLVRITQEFLANKERVQ